jgi:hypothetical protein
MNLFVHYLLSFPFDTYVRKYSYDLKFFSRPISCIRRDYRASSASLLNWTTMRTEYLVSARRYSSPELSTAALQSGDIIRYLCTCHVTWIVYFISHKLTHVIALLFEVVPLQTLKFEILIL